MPPPPMPGADGQVQERIQSLRRAPAMLAQRRAVDIRVEANRHVESTTNRAGKVGVRPARLGCGGDVAIGWRRGIEIYRAERGNAHGRQVCLLRLEEIDRAANRLVRCGGRELGLPQRRSSCAAANRANELGAARSIPP